MPLWPIFLCKSLPCRWLETEVQRRPLHCDKHPPQEKGGARGMTNASRATALPEMNPSSVLFCSRHRVQRATISEVTLGKVESRAERCSIGSHDWRWNQWQRPATGRWRVEGS